MKPFQITTIRHSDDTGRTLIDRYCFSGAYGGPRVPRGIDPDLVSIRIIERLRLDGGSDIFRRVLDMIRFYERPDVAAHMGRVLLGKEINAGDVSRSNFTLQAAGDVGAADLVKPAVDYFEKRIVPSAHVVTGLTLLLDTALTLSPPGKIDAAGSRVAAEAARLAKAQRNSEADMLAYDSVAAVQRNHLPRVKAAADVKAKLSALKPAERCEELVKIYLVKSPVSDDYMQVWAARMLRRDVMATGPEAACATFSKFIELANPKNPQIPRDDFVIHRAAQAIMYFGVKLNAAEREVYGYVQTKSMNFLWDDLAE